MSRFNSLPGFDAWLTHNPQEDVPEPSTKHYDKARELLNADNEEVSEQEIEAKAYELMYEEIEQSRVDAEEAEAESRLDDMNREI